MIKAIIFDCFGVLYVDSSRYFYETYVKNYDQLRPQLADLNRQYDIGYMSQADLNGAVAELTGLERSFVDNRILGMHQRNEALLEYSQSLRADYQLGMLSNIGRDGMNTYFSADERDTYFDSVVLSSEVGMIKPDPAIFELMATELGVLPEECIMIDDVAMNIAGAKEAGMRGIVYHSNKQTIDDIHATVHAVR